jgi:hypothetical protein
MLRHVFASGSPGRRSHVEPVIAAHISACRCCAIGLDGIDFALDQVDRQLDVANRGTYVDVVQDRRSMVEMTNGVIGARDHGSPLEVFEVASLLCTTRHKSKYLVNM